MKRSSFSFALHAAMAVWLTSVAVCVFLVVLAILGATF